MCYVAYSIVSLTMFSDVPKQKTEITDDFDSFLDVLCISLNAIEAAMEFAVYWKVVHVQPINIPIITDTVPLHILLGCECKIN